MGAAANTAIGVIAVVVMLSILVIGLWFLVQSIRWAIRRLFTPPAHPVAKILSILVAFLLVPSVLIYVFELIVSLAYFVPTTIQSILASISSPVVCSNDCAAVIIRDFIGMLGSVFEAFIDALLVGRFPVWDLIVFLLIYFCLYNGYLWLIGSRAVGNQLNKSPIASQIFINFAFFLLVGFAFYLSLTALLAISLQSQNTADGFTPEDLETIILADLPSKEAFDSRYPTLEATITIPAELGEDGKQLATRLAEIATLLADRSTAARDSSHDELTAIKTIAISEFRNQNAQRAGGRETIEHFGIVVEWYQSERREMEQALKRCVRTATSVIRRAKSAVEG